MLYVISFCDGWVVKGEAGVLRRSMVKQPPIDVSFKFIITAIKNRL